MCIPIAVDVNYGCGCCEPFSPKGMKETWENEKKAWNEGDCLSCCGYGLASRAKWLVRAVICPPHSLYWSVGYGLGGIAALACSILPAVGGLLGGAATGGCCCGNEEGCKAFKATEGCAYGCAVAGGSRCGLAGLAALSALCELSCIPINGSCPELPGALCYDPCSETISQFVETHQNKLQANLASTWPKTST